MAVYVDPVRTTRPNRRWSRTCGTAHLTADTVEELVAFGERLGLKRSWLQNTWTPHYVITAGMRQKAIVMGAQPVGMAEVAEISRKAGVLKWGPRPAIPGRRMPR